MKNNSCFSVTQPLLANKSIKFAFVSHLTLYIIFLSVVQTLLYPNLFLASLNSLILILVELSVIVIPFPFSLFVGKYLLPVLISYKLKDYGSVFYPCLEHLFYVCNHYLREKFLNRFLFLSSLQLLYLFLCSDSSLHHVDNTISPRILLLSVDHG